MVAVGTPTLSGTSPESTFSYFALARSHMGGALNNSFSGDARKTTSFGGRLNAADGLQSSGDGKILAAGTTAPAAAGGGAGAWATSPWPVTAGRRSRGHATPLAMHAMIVRLNPSSLGRKLRNYGPECLD